MLRLHGFSFSNYHSLVKVVLIEKGIEFDEVTVFPPADQDYLSKNPTGKFPCLELEDGTFLGETQVILNYLEEAYPRTPLLPTDPLARKCHQTRVRPPRPQGSSDGSARSVV